LRGEIGAVLVKGLYSLLLLLAPTAAAALGFCCHLLYLHIGNLEAQKVVAGEGYKKLNFTIIRRLNLDFHAWLTFCLIDYMHLTLAEFLCKLLAGKTLKNF